MRDDGGFVWEATMSEKKDDGGAAFPEQGVHGGMSLRDWFAGMAMQGILAWGSGKSLTPEQVAEDAYDTADAMIEARKQ